MAVPTIEAVEIDDGTGDAISVPDADGIQTLTDAAALFVASMAEGRIIIAGGAGANNGNFFVIDVPSPTTIRYLNAGGVVEGSFTGTWSATVNPINPTKGPSGGRTVVEILGTNFRLPTVPPSTGFVGGDFEESVQVVIGGRRTLDVQVISNQRLFCTTQSREPILSDVVLTNIDSAGDPIGGETVTLPNSYTYARTRLDALAESDLVRLCRTIIRELKKQIIDNVTMTTATDFDEDPADATNFIEIAELPQLVLVGPEFAESRFYTDNQPIEEDPDQATFELGIRRFPKVVDVSFNLIGASDNTTELLNMMFAVQSFFNRTKDLVMLRTTPAGDPNAAFPVDPDPADVITYEMDIETGGQFGVTTRPNNSNLRTFSGSFVIRGFEIEDLPDFPADLLVAVTREVLQSDLCPTIEQFGG
jgi:hypothetical protein